MPSSRGNFPGFAPNVAQHIRNVRRINEESKYEITASKSHCATLGTGDVTGYAVALISCPFAGPEVAGVMQPPRFVPAIGMRWLQFWLCAAVSKKSLKLPLLVTALVRMQSLQMPRTLFFFPCVWIQNCNRKIN